MLIRLRFIPSELSALLGISPQSVTNMRQRLLQKLFHEKGGAKDFDEKIRAI
jgi:putative tetratricopeptide repeat-containing domain protein